VTKVMTLLLLMEAVEAGQITLNDTVTVSANAASMGGSQVFLKEGEQMRMEELLKCVIIASANDAAVALAEYLCGSVSVFVDRMNEKARILGMSATRFENVTGLDDTAEQHLTSAHDIAVMSRELIRYPKVLEYSSRWMDTIRNGAFGLTNTNRLVRFYRGCTGLKTGSTAKAGFCVSVTAQRDDFSLICVIMGAESRDVRNAAASSLLDWGFANYGLFRSEGGALSPMVVTGGKKDSCELTYGSFSCVVEKNAISRVEQRIELPEAVAAPVKKGSAVGRITYWIGDRELGGVNIEANEEIGRINFFEILRRMIAAFLLI
ncbi:MAG: D-alanyl-D-alanine carboxypeptidase, partial [Ruminococcaceae bacterium]|nr:D-alanyl-D-alanine carboxypeptidase [Oscillospiraceae bacterium]